MGLAFSETAALTAIMFIAAIARGYAGFGSSAIVIAAASLFIAPTILVPVLYILEVGASVAMFRSIRNEVDYPLYISILAGCAIGLPAGQWLLTNLPADTVRIALSLVVLVCAILLWRGFHLGFRQNHASAFLTGVATGLGSGLAVIGGLIMVVILYATDFGAGRTRAMCIAVFLVMYSYGTGVAALNGLVTAQTLWLTAILAVPLIAGVYVGQRQYLLTSPERFRRFILVFLMVLSAVGTLRALLL